MPCVRTRLHLEYSLSYCGFKTRQKASWINAERKLFRRNKITHIWFNGSSCGLCCALRKLDSKTRKWLNFNRLRLNLQIVEIFIAYNEDDFTIAIYRTDHHYKILGVINRQIKKNQFSLSGREFSSETTVKDDRRSRSHFHFQKS